MTRHASVAGLLLAAAACSANVRSRPATSNESTPKAAANDVVLLVNAPEGLGLFREEARLAQADIAHWAAAQGWHLVDGDQASEVVERARAGRSATTGEVCGRALAPWVAKKRWRGLLAAEGELQTQVTCNNETKRCTLETWAFRKSGDSIFELSAPFDRATPWRTALAESLAALTPRGEEDTGGMGLIGSGEGGTVKAQPEHLGYSLQPAVATDDAQGELTEELTFADGQAALRACFRHKADVDLLVAVDGKGTVKRCESGNGDDATSACVCTALFEQGRGTAALYNRRFHFALSFQTADVVTPANAVVSMYVRTYVQSYRDENGRMLFRPSVSDPSIEDWQPPADDIVAGCFADVTTAGAIDAWVSVDFDSRGQAAAVAVKTAKDHPFSSTQVACLQKAFMQSLAPCPAVATARADAQIHGELRPIGSEL